MSDLITIASSVIPRSAKVIGFRGIEAISRPYEVEVFFLLRGDDANELDMADAIGAKARLVLDRAVFGAPPHYFAGVLSIVEMLHAVEGQALFRAVIVPRLQHLALSVHSRVFTGMSVVSVIEAVLEDNGFSSTDYEKRLRGYESEEHITQYRESDLAFVSRWMEREGIFYFFEHSEDGEKLILCDHLAYEKDRANRPVRYHPQLGHDRTAGESLRSFSARYTGLPGAVKVRDYDYGKPNLSVAGEAKVDENGSGEISVYGDRVFAPGAAKRLARMRAEELLARKVLLHGTGSRLHLRPGYSFELEDHPRAPLNAEYLAIEVHHEGNQAADFPAFKELLGLSHEDVYFVEVDAIPAGTQFRAESRTLWPRIYGFENGNVDGAASSEYAQIDDHGRYNVKLKFDESDRKGGKASTWVRMMQPHGGGVEGFHFPLRKGTEVVISFLGGDPDRPVISGVVPNAITPSPVTSGNHTKNVLQTGGRNRLELEDLAGQQRITLSTPYASTHLQMGDPAEQHELVLHTDENMLVDAHLAYDTVVGVAPGSASGAGNMTVTVQNNLVTTVKQQDMTTTVETGNMTIKVDTGTLTEEVKGDVTETYHANQTTKIDADRTITVTGQTRLHSTGSIFVNTADQLQVESASAASLKVNSGGLTETIQGGQTTTVDGGAVLLTSKGGDINIEATGGHNISLKANNVKTTNTGDWVHETFGDWVKFTWNKGVEFTAATKINITGGAQSDTFIGLRNSNFVGLKVDTSIAGWFTLSMGVGIKVSPAAEFEMSFGKITSCQFNLEEHLMFVANIGARLEANGFTLIG